MNLTHEEIRWIIVKCSSNADRISFNEFMYIMTAPRDEDKENSIVKRKRKNMHDKIMNMADDIDLEEEVF